MDTQLKPSLQTTNEQALSRIVAQRPEQACARRPKEIVRQSQSLARGQANKTSADGHDCESALGGKADTPFVWKAEWTAKIVR